MPSGQRLEQALIEPAVEERCHPVALRIARELVVGRSSRRTPLGRLDSRGAAQQHESLDEPRPVEREAKAQPCTHRVADPHARAASVAERVGRRREVEPVRHLERLHVPLAREEWLDRFPRPGRLAEAVHQPETHEVILARGRRPPGFGAGHRR